MNEVTGYLPFSPQDLDMQNYTLSLLGQCSLHGLISTSRLQEIQLGLQEAFLETAAQFTRRESSSLPRKRAELLYSSVLYQADVFLIRLQSPQNAISVLNTMPIPILLQAGQDLVLEIHRQNIHIFREAYALRLPFDIFGYRYVMDTAFDEYFQNYSARFDARNCIATIDYPLLGIPAYALQTQGALFIREYYTGILHENQLCALFPQHKLEALLRAYGTLYRCSYLDLVVNIAELLMNNLIACALAEKPFSSIFITKTDLAHLQKRYAPMANILIEVQKAFAQYEDNIPIPECYEYLCRYLPLFTQEFCFRLQKGELEHFLVCHA